MLIVYTKHCLASSKENFLKVRLAELEKQSIAWDSAEQLPSELFLVSSEHHEFTGRVMYQEQRDEFNTYYVDERDEITLVIEHD